MILLLQFFLSGLALGASMCGMHYSILLAPMVVKTSPNWKEGIKVGLCFGAGKVIMYGIFGGIAVYSGYLIEDILLRSSFRVAGGIILILIGIWFLLSTKKCRGFFKTAPPFLLGLVDGIFPCAPFLGFLLYLAYISREIYFGILAGILFGMGTIISAVVISGITPYLWRKLSFFSKVDIILRIIGLSIFFFWGITLLLRK